MRKIAVVGGGAAGMMAVATIVENMPVWSYEIHLFEKNNILGNKVLISGGWRCNVTTGYYKKKDFLGKYIRGAIFLETAMATFGPRKVYQWFEQHGVPLKIEKDMRVFPVSNNGKDIVGVFEKIFTERDVHVHFKEWIQDLAYLDDKKFSLTTAMQSYTFDAVVLTTGGNAYAHTGSSGEWYELAKKVWHTITNLGPSLNSFQTPHDWMHALTGLSFPWARLQVVLSDGRQESVDGPVLLTHFGISGPNVFALSALVAFEKISPDHPLDIVLIPEAETTMQMWLDRLQEAAISQPKKELINILKVYFPQRMVQALLHVMGVSGTTYMASLTKDDKKTIVWFLTWWWKLQLTMRRPGDEFVTAGWVSCDEVNSSTMESTLCPGLYFAGELLDVDGVTGGFNLQSSWATGYLAGMSITKL